LNNIIRVDLLEQLPYADQVPGTKYEVRQKTDRKAPKFEYEIAEFGIKGILSREPLLDACRQLVGMGDKTASRQIALYRPGNATPDLICSSVAHGALLTVREDRERGPVFVKWQYYPIATHNKGGT
jgi:hypothetical protein